MLQIQVLFKMIRYIDCFYLCNIDSLLFSFVTVVVQEGQYVDIL